MTSRASSRRFLARAFRVATTPPRAEEWGAFGRSYVVPPVRVTEPSLVRIGDGVLLHENCWLSVVRPTPDATPVLDLADGVRVGRGCQFSVAGSVTVGEDSVIGDFSQIGDTFHPYDAVDRVHALSPPEPVRIGRRVVLGSHVTVLPGVTVGDGAVVDHHAVVTADVPAGAVVSGAPARLRP